MTSNTPSDGTAGDERDLIAVLAEDAASRAGDHPEADELVDYLGDSLSPEAESRVQNHLVSCRSCARTLLDLEPLMAPESAEQGVADLEVAAAWREVKARAGTAEAQPSRSRQPRWLAAVAASFFVATLGLSAWVVQLRDTVGDLAAPQSNYEILYFESTRSLGEDVLRVPDGHHRLPVIVTGVDAGAYESYEVTVINAVGAEVLQIGGLTPSDVGSLRLEIPVTGLSAGDYGLVLYGANGGERELVREMTGVFRYSEN